MPLQFDMENLRTELAALYTSNWLRRVVMDLFTPWAMQLFRSFKMKISGGKKVESQDPEEEDKFILGRSSEVSEELLHRVEFQLAEKEYEQFDDYLEVSENLIF